MNILRLAWLTRCMVVAIVLVSLLVVLIPIPGVEADAAVIFPDSNLEAAIREAIGKTSGDVFESDLIGLTEFRASDRLIRNLAGLEHCTSLEQLILNGNQITDLSPLAGLTRLFRLWLWNNQIGNLSPLTGLTSLRSLSLAGNYVSDLSPLAGLTSLWKLYLDYNQISNIEPLVDNPGIGSGDEIYLEGNPLNSVSVNTYIPQLEAEGAIVYWDTTNHPPAKPTNLLPANAATGVSLTPTLQSSAFSDPDSGDNLAASQWQIRTSMGSYSSAVYGGTGTTNSINVPPGYLAYSTTYYWHVRHQDDRGDWSNWSTETYFTTTPDPTPPTTPVVTDDGASTTSTGYLHGSWTSSDPESGVAEYQYAIGVSSGGTEVVNWTSVGMSTQVTKTGLSLGVGTTYYFAVKARNGDGLWSAVGVSDGIVVVTPPDTTPPTTPVVTDEGSTTVSTTQLQASWSCSDPETGIAEYQYAIGVSSGGTEVVNWTSVGTSTLVTRTGLSLSVGATYYFAVKARNGDGLWSQVGVSNGITVLAPENHAPAQPTNYLPAPGATGMSPTPTLQSSAFSDPDAGDPHAASQWQIRTSTGSYDVPAYESTSQSSLVSISVSPGSLTYSTTYYWHVRHQDSRGGWSGWSIETFFTTVPDQTPPTTPVVTDDGATTASSSELRASWSCSDLESGIAEYQYAIGTASGANNVVDWTSAGKSTQATETGLSLKVGTTYYFAVKARNGSGVWSEVGVSDGIKAVAVTDTTPPSTPVVKDDGTTTTKASQLHATWTSSDPESGIAEYQYAIGTLAGGTDVVGWTSVGTNTQVIKMSLSLTLGTTYYFAVKARNHAGLWSEVGFSDGIAVVASADTTPPTIPVVTDDGASTTSVSQLYAYWTSSDPESGIAEYQYAIGTSPGATDVIGWTAVGKSTEVTSAGLSLTLGTTYYFGVKAQNGAGIWSEVGVSDGIMVVDEDGGGGEVGGCCARSNVETSADDLAVVWGTLGICCGTGLLIARRVGKGDRR